MAEPQKPATSLVNSKEKSSLLDIGIEKDFWKSMSVADDGMDFDFGSAAKGQKGFKFGKMDMDLSLDADFGNPSSFKINMSDLDISSPPKRSGKSKDKSNEVSSGGEHQPKRDSFSLFFDFNEVDKFDFGPETKKIDAKSNKNKDKVGSGDHLAKDVDAMEDFDILPQHPASCGVSTSKVDMQIEDDPLKCVIEEESCLLSPANVEEQKIPRAIALENIISSNLQEPIQEALSLEKKSPEHDAQKVVDLSDQSLAENVSMQDAISDIQEVENRAVARTVSSNTVSDQNQSEDTSSQSQKGEMRKSRDDDVLIGDTRVDDSDTSKGDSNLENTLMKSGIENLAHGALVNQKNADSISKLCLNSLESGTTADELVTDKERSNTVSRSKYFKKETRSESELQQASLSPTKLIPIGSSKGLSTTHKNPAVEKRELGSKGVESGSKFTGILRSLPKELSRGIPVQIENTETGRGKGLDRKGLAADSIKTGSELTTTTVANDVGVTKEELVSKERVLNTEHRKVVRSDVNPSSLNEHLNKAIGQNPGLKVTSLASSQNTRKIVVEKNKKSPITIERITSEVPNIKASRAMEVKLKPLSCSLSKDLTSIRNKEHHEELRRTMVLKRTPSLDTKKQMLPSPTLKRQRIEKSAEIPRFTPLQRSPSPSSINTSSEKAVNEQAYNHANVGDDNAKYAIFHTPKIDISLKGLDISPAIGNDRIVEKAEACSKELEDICNMLKKKHEEAKDILVRAIVNNNNLLMLNHPIYQDKMSMVQKFAASLKLK